jgi:hypothetical protein
MCKEAALRWFEVQSQRLPEWTEETHKIPIKITGLLVEIWHRDPQTESKNLPTGLRSSKYERGINGAVNSNNTYGLKKPVVIQMFM